MNKKFLFSAAALLLAALCLFSCFSQAGRELDFARIALPDGGHGILFLPKSANGMVMPAVELLRNGGGELLRCVGTALELGRRGYAVLLVPFDHAGGGWDVLCKDGRFYSRSLAAGCFEGGRSALIALWESASGEEYAPRALLFLSTDVPVETEGAQNVLSLCPGEVTEAGMINGYFAEGTARRTVTLSGSSEVSRLREGLPWVIDWTGSTLGHPIDGLYADDDYMYPRCGALLLSGAVFLVLSPVPFLFSRRKRSGSPESD